jgi:hypothetical protein
LAALLVLVLPQTERPRTRRYQGCLHCQTAPHHLQSLWLALLLRLVLLLLLPAVATLLQKDEKQHHHRC